MKHARILINLLMAIVYFATFGQQAAKKELYLPKKVWMVRENNDYADPNSIYNYDHMLSSDNIAIFWNKEYGKDPMANQDASMRFNPERMLSECEKIYDVYVNQLKLVKAGNSRIDQYKVLVYVYKGEGNTAFGGGEEDKVGIFWTPSTRINKEPYGVLAHELGHSFQYLSRADSGKGPTGPIMEMSAQYMLWQVYPDWMRFENYHLESYLKGTHYGFLHPYNMYHSPYIIEYWSQKHGKTFFGELMRNSNPGEDAVMTYKRINNLNQEQFNDEMFEACSRFISWDLERIDSIARPYANMHFTKLQQLSKDLYAVDSINCPQNYGYNGIRLDVPKSGTKIKLSFKGQPTLSKVKPEKAGWRYGFVAQLKSGKRLYSETFKKETDTVAFKVPKETAYLWLVVMGAPSEHWSKGEKGVKNPDEQWPYQFGIKGTSVNGFPL